ncbi:hypothetical protein LZ31DRAFT_209548 [Colletotrichum somersetense]|nr:hypothetical protein LZ31DRAFT_209548 [Colletotrichum somersetense]
MPSDIVPASVLRRRLLWLLGVVNTALPGARARMRVPAEVVSFSSRKIIQFLAASFDNPVDLGDLTHVPSPCAGGPRRLWTPGSRVISLRLTGCSVMTRDPDGLFWSMALVAG